MIEDRSGEDEPVEESHGQADGHTLIEVPQHSAGSGAMDVEIIAVASVAGGDDEGMAIANESDVADESFVEDSVGSFAIVGAAMGLADDLGAGSGAWEILAGSSASGSRLPALRLRASGFWLLASVASDYGLNLWALGLGSRVSDWAFASAERG